jgi:hypothetical protein
MIAATSDVVLTLQDYQFVATGRLVGPKTVCEREEVLHHNTTANLT